MRRSRTSPLRPRCRRGGPSLALAARSSCAAYQHVVAVMLVGVLGCVVVVGGGARAAAAMVVWAGTSSCFAGTCCPRRRGPRSLAPMSPSLSLATSGVSCSYLSLDSRAWVVAF